MSTTLLATAVVTDNQATAREPDEASIQNQAAAIEPDEASIETVAETVSPEGPLRPSKVTKAQMEAAAEKREERREGVAVAALVNDPALVSPDISSEAVAAGAQTEPVDPENSEALQVRRNFRNTIAQTASSTLGETAAANEGAAVFYTGNTYQSRSGNSGANWLSAGLFPAGPADAPIPCCDQDVVRAHDRDRLFSTMLYVNGAQTNGVVRIFVRNSPLSPPLCSYLIDPAGAANNSVADYPHISLSRNFLYLGLNNTGALNNTQMRRFNLTQMSACQTTGFNTFTRSNSVAHRVFVPSEGFEGSTEMIWGQIETATSFRAYRWPESTPAVTQVVRGGLASSNYSNPDCRGGTGNNDFIERTTAWSPSGFRLRGAKSGGTVTWWWNVNRDAAHTQAHVHSVSLRLSDLATLSQPHIFNNTTCFGYPAVDGNAFGEHGLSIAVGGRLGGGGLAARGFVGVDDASSVGIHFPTVALTASGTHNRADGRYGDYFTMRTKSQCSRSWVTNNYSLLNGNTLAAHVNARYVELGSSFDSVCLNAN